MTTLALPDPTVRRRSEADPTARELQPCDRFDWERIVRRCRIHRDTKLVAYTLAQYGDAHGRDIRPGVRRIAAVCDMGERTVNRHVSKLVSLGLVERLANGGGRSRWAALYRLTVPTDLLEHVDLLDQDERTQATWVASVPSPSTPNSGHLGGLSSSAQPVDNSGTQATQMASVPEPINPELRPSGTELRPNRGLTQATQVAYHQETNQTPTKTSPEVSTSPVGSQPRADQLDPPANSEPPAAPPPRRQAPPAAPPSGAPRQRALWPAAVPDLPPDPDVYIRMRPGELRARIAAARPQAARGAS